MDKVHLKEAIEMALEKSDWADSRDLLKIHQRSKTRSDWDVRTLNYLTKKGLLIGRENPTTKSVEVNEVSFLIISWVSDLFKDFTKAKNDYSVLEEILKEARNRRNSN